MATFVLQYAMIIYSLSWSNSRRSFVKERQVGYTVPLEFAMRAEPEEAVSLNSSSNCQLEDLDGRAVDVDEAVLGHDEK